MSTIHIHQMSKADVMLELTHHRSLVSDVVEYLKATQPELAKTTVAYEEVAKEIIYAECEKAFRYSDYVTSAASAISKVDSNYGRWVREENRKMKEKAEREALKLEKLKQKCKEKGLDFEKEKVKRRRRQKFLNARVIAVLCFLALALVTLILAVCGLCEYEISLAFVFFAVCIPVSVLIKKGVKKFLGL